MNDAVVYDTGMLIALASHDARAQAQHTRITSSICPIVPGPVLTQVWRTGSRVQNILGQFLKHCSLFVHYTETDYKRAGVMLGNASLPGKKRPDAVDALVALTAVKHEAAAVLTSDPHDITAYLATLPKTSAKVIAI